MNSAKIGLWILLCGVLLLGSSASVQAEGQAVGSVVFVSGEATVQRNGDSPVTLNFGDRIYPRDILETGDGELRVLFQDQTVLSLVANSKVMITEHVYRSEQGERRSIFDLISGGVRAVIERTADMTDSEVLIQTPTAVAGIRGTIAATYHNPVTNISHFLCFDGWFETYHRDYPNQKVVVNEGHITKVIDGPPHRPVPIPDDWHQFFSSSYTSIRDLIKQRGGKGLDSIADARPGVGVAGGPAMEQTDLTMPPGFSGLPGALSEIPLSEAGVAGGDGGGAGGGGGPGGGGGGGAAPVNVQPGFPDPG